jgi:hypothetical protein
MLKRSITYTDFEDREVTEVFYFNISKPELIDMEVEHEGGYVAAIQRIIDANDPKQLVAEFKKLILQAYGIKSDDGKKFMKSDALREEFIHHAAYQTLWMELASNEKAASEFVIGVLPADLSAARDEDKPVTQTSPAPALEAEG